MWSFLVYASLHPHTCMYIHAHVKRKSHFYYHSCGTYTYVCPSAVWLLSIFWFEHHFRFYFFECFCLTATHFPYMFCLLAVYCALPLSKNVRFLANCFSLLAKGVAKLNSNGTALHLNALPYTHTHTQTHDLYITHLARPWLSWALLLFLPHNCKLFFVSFWSWFRFKSFVNTLAQFISALQLSFFPALFCWLKALQRFICKKQW